LLKCAQVIGIKKGGHMVQTTAILNGFMQKIKNAGLSLGEGILGIIYMIVVFVGLWIFKILQGIYFFVLGAIVFYFIAGGIGWILCFVLSRLGHAYLGH